MNKKLLKKFQVGLISFSTLALLAACGNDGIDDPTIDDEPGVEDPMEEDEDAGTGGVTEEEEEN